MPTGARPLRVLIAGSMCLLLAATALAQFGRGRFVVHPNVHYDGRFTFVRLKYTTAPGGFWYGGWPAWCHGHPISPSRI